MTEEKYKKKKEENYKLDEDGHIIVAENVPVIFVGGVTPYKQGRNKDKDDSR